MMFYTVHIIHLTKNTLNFTEKGRSKRQTPKKRSHLNSQHLYQHWYGNLLLVTGWWLSMYWTWLVSRVNGWLYSWLYSWLYNWLYSWLYGWLYGWLHGWLYGWLYGKGQRRHIYGRFHSLPATYSTLLLLPSSWNTLYNILQINNKSQTRHNTKITNSA